MTFTGQNIRKLTGQKSMSFLLESCSVNNLTGSGEFGFSDQGSNTIKFRFEQGNIYDFDNVNVSSYIEGEEFKISGDISETSYSYKIDDKIIAEGITKSNFELKEFFINTTSCDISTYLKIYADETSYSISTPASIQAGDSFNVTINNSSSDSTIYIFAASLDTVSATEFSIGSFTAPLAVNSNSSNSLTLTNSSSLVSNSTSVEAVLTLHTNIGTIEKNFSIQVAKAPLITTTNSLSLVSETDTSTGKEFLYKFTSSVFKMDYMSISNTGHLSQTSTVSLEYVSGDIGTFYEVLGVNITNGGSNYVTPEVLFGAQTSPDTTATGTASATNGVIDGVTITNTGNIYGGVPTVTFSDAANHGTSATGVASTLSYDKTFTNCFDMGVEASEEPVINFLSQGLTLDEGDATYPYSTFGKGMYKQTQPITLTETSDLYYIKIVYTDKNDYHPISVKLKVESAYADSATGRTIEEQTINITETV